MSVVSLFSTFHLPLKLKMKYTSYDSGKRLCPHCFGYYRKDSMKKVDREGRYFDACRMVCVSCWRKYEYE